MKRIVQAIAVLFLLTPLAACEYHKLQQLNYAEPVGDPFQKALWANYRDLTHEEERNYDWEQAVIYADKALSSAYGEDVLPDDPTQWELPDSLVKQFVKAREDLLVIIAGDAKAVRPQLVADAQTNFDCWLEHQAENTRPDDIGACRDAFYAAMQKLITPEPAKEETPKSKAAKPAAKKAEVKPAPMPEPVKEESKPEPVSQPAAVPELTPVPAVEPTPTIESVPQVEAPVEASKPPVTPFNPPKEQPTSPVPPETKPLAPQSMLKKPGKEMETASYIVFFDAGQAALNPTAEKIVDGAAQSLMQHKNYKVIVNARNDLFGNVESGLPAQRAQMVKSRLVLQGISEASIEMLLAGEASPAAGTQSTPVERRVEIFISE
jgi:outer membrane protein OmpA-like peptidoglycan-associated protein